MKKLQFLLIFITFSSLFISPTLAQVPDSIYHQRLYHLCKIWGFVKYHHSEIANGNVNWDDELINRLPGIKLAPNNQAFNDSLLLLINSAGETIIGQGELPELPDSLTLVQDWSWMNDELHSVSLTEKLHYIHEQFRPMSHVNITTHNEGVAVYLENQYNWPGVYPIEEHRILALFRYWNMINYYYPYKNIMDQNWDSTLKQFIEPIVEAKNADKYHLSMKALSVKLNDSHAFFYSPVYTNYFGQAAPPFYMMWIEEKFVITKVLPNEENIKVGDILLEIDHLKIEILIDSFFKYAEGSNLASKFRSLNYFIRHGTPGPVEIKIFNGTDTMSFSTNRDYDNLSLLNKLESYPIWFDTTINESCNIAYVNMKLLHPDDVETLFNEYSNKDAIIFDQRNYPNLSLWEIVNYIHSGPIINALMATPDITYPGKIEYIPYYLGQGTNNPYMGKVIILFNEESISQSEFTIMGLEQHPNSIKIGSTTNGTDGNVTHIRLPGQIKVYHTGLGVFYPDYTPTQRVGIIPDYYVRPTIKGIRAGRDEVLEFALSCSLGTEKLNTEFDISIFPNPTDGLINYEFQGQNFVPKSTIRLTNVNGQIVYDKTICDFKGAISTTHLPAGVYLLSIFNEEFRTTEKIIVN